MSIVEKSYEMIISKFKTTVFNKDMVPDNKSVTYTRSYTIPGMLSKTGRNQWVAKHFPGLENKPHSKEILLRS